MFRSKRDVDVHVRDVFAKSTSESDRLKLCFGIAKQYACIKEFDSARRYLKTYLGSSPANSAEAYKLMGDIHLELGEPEIALENYKASYLEGKGRDSLNRVCDLLTRGFGAQETAESKKKWFEMQKSSTNPTTNSILANTFASSPAAYRKPQITGGPPKTGFSNASLVNGSSSPLVSMTNKANNGNNVDLQLRYLEKRFDDGLGKILDQNTMLIEQILKMKDEMKELTDKVEQVSLAQQKIQSDIKEYKEKEDLKIKLLESTAAAPKSGPMASTAAAAAVPIFESVGARASSTVTITPVAKSVDVPLSEMFKKPEGSWNCSGCYLSNSREATSCAACQTVCPGHENAASNNLTQTQAPAAATPFNFGFPTAPSGANPNFSFGTPSSTTDTTPAKQPEVSETSKTPFEGLNLSGKFSFGELAKNNNSAFTFGTASGTPAFSGTGSVLFSTLSNSTASGSPNTTLNEVSKVDLTVNKAGNAEDGEDDFVPTAEFQPVIPLPPLVEVKKGDENENTIVEYRAKLYRFVADTKEWKERGVGNIKLLQSKDDPSKCRVVMWREKIGKLACNFSLFADMTVTNYQGNGKVLCWKCHDFAEEPNWETFTLRFGNEENCEDFKNKLMEYAKIVASAVTASPPRSNTAQTDNSKVPPVSKSADVPLSEMFKKPEGSWNCSGCYLSNSKDTTSCAACQSVRPGHENTASNNHIQTQAPAATTTFNFGFPTAPSGANPNFSFGTPSSTTDTTPLKQPEVSETSKTPFEGLNLSGKFTFGELAKNNNSAFTFGNVSGTPAFSGAGSVLFSTLSNSTTSGSPNTNLNEVSKADSTVNNSGNADDGDDDFVPTAEFQPVIPLPPLVDVKKGDENENTIVEYRAKLYRFVADTKEWKERGVGNIKLLQSKDDPSKCRVVMWREKIGKLACNFSLFADMTVTNYQGNGKVLCWKCHDFAEEPNWETFTLRFGNEDNCEDFKNKLMEYARIGASAGTASPQRVSQTESSTVTITPVLKSADVPLSEMFKKPEGSWNCSGCYLSNSKDTTSCAACQTVRPGHENAASNNQTQTQAPAAATTFNFGFPTAPSGTNPNFSFGTPSSTTDTTPAKQPEVSETSKTPFEGLNLSGKFTFGELAKNNNSAFTFGTAGGTPAFSGAGSLLFSSTANSANTTLNKTSNEDANDTSANAEEGEDDFVPNVEFQPVIPLPPLVDVKKGDENENTIVEYRAKLYRFVSESKEWKERGVGNIKLLQSKDDPSKCRVVMWREKIGKLACNFSLFADMTVTNYQGNGKVLCWKCHDFAEEPNWETFTLRFGNEDNCEDFKNKLLEYAKDGASAGAASPPRAAQTESSCTGCIGCDPDNFRFPEHKKISKERPLDIPLSDDSCSDPPFVVSLNLFETLTQNLPDQFQFVSINPSPDVSGGGGGDNDQNEQETNSSLSNFSFSLQTPQKEAPTSNSASPFQIKTPTFSFKPAESSPSIFGGSVFSPPQINISTTSPASPFISPFAQQSQMNNFSTASQQSVVNALNFSSPNFMQPQGHSPADANNDEEDDEDERDEDEYEDVDDEEDECMFEDDAQIFVKEGSGFVDKGEGMVKILYDGESYCARLVLTVDGNAIAEHLVAVETILESPADLTYEWTGVCNEEAPVKTRIKVTFLTSEAYQSFATVMSDSLEFATQAGITEDFLLDDGTGY